MARARERGNGSAGFTLVEVLVAVVLLGLGAALASGSASESLARLRVESAIRRVATGLERGRVGAQRQGRPCALRLSEAGWGPPQEGSLAACPAGEMALGEGLADGEVRLLHNFAGDVRFSSNGLVIDGGTVVVEAAGTELRRCLVLALPLGVVRLGRYQGEGRGPGQRRLRRRSPSVRAAAMDTRAVKGGKERGFTLVELLLALAVGLMVWGLIVQALLGEERISQRLGRHWREKTVQRRTLELVRGELLRAEAVGTAAGGGAAACGLGGRQVVLHLAMGAAQQPVTYSVGAAPSPIWRGAVLMRCGPAFGLDGWPSSGAAQNRVVIDGLVESEGFTAVAEGEGLLRLRLRQEFPGPAGGGVQRIESELITAVPAQMASASGGEN